MLKPLYACTVAESIIIDAAENEESLEPEHRRQRPRAGSVELSPTGTEWNARDFTYSNPDRNVYLWSCAGGDRIPLKGSQDLSIYNYDVDLWSWLQVR